MCKIVCVTNRRLCGEDFLKRIEKIASSHPEAIILREKDLSEAEYKPLAEKAIEICNRHSVRIILHTYTEVAKKFGLSVHLSISAMRALTEQDRKSLVFGVSCHSVEEAIEAEKSGASYVTAGHIFDTDCKKGTPGRGIEFLKRVCESVSIPVYAIGGIDTQNARQVIEVGANGVCIMSGEMTSKDVNKYITDLKSAVNKN